MGETLFSDEWVALSVADRRRLMAWAGWSRELARLPWEALPRPLCVALMPPLLARRRRRGQESVQLEIPGVSDAR